MPPGVSFALSSALPEIEGGCELASSCDCNLKIEPQTECVTKFFIWSEIGFPIIPVFADLVFRSCFAFLKKIVENLICAPRLRGCECKLSQLIVVEIVVAGLVP